MTRTDILTVGKAVTLSTEYLAKKGSPSARLDSQILVAYVLGTRRLDLYLAPERPLSREETDRLRELMVRRGRLEPVAYLTGHKEFFGLSFIVNRSVLVPRPETESVVDAAINFLKGVTGPALTSEQNDRMLTAADIGTGSGAIACAVASNVKNVSFTAGDVSRGALAVGQRNADKLDVADRIHFVQSDIFEGIGSNDIFDMIVSNPPYIADREVDIVDEAAKNWEPSEALFSGPEGIDMTFRLIGQASARLKPHGALIVETGTPTQRARVLERMKTVFETVTEINDPGENAVGVMAVRPISRQ